MKDMPNREEEHNPDKPCGISGLTAENGPLCGKPADVLQETPTIEKDVPDREHKKEYAQAVVRCHPGVTLCRHWARGEQVVCESRHGQPEACTGGRQGDEGPFVEGGMRVDLHPKQPFFLTQLVERGAYLFEDTCSGRDVFLRGGRCKGPFKFVRARVYLLE